MVTRPSSVIPRLPRVTGSTVSSRTNAKAAREVCQGALAWDKPVPRKHVSRTSHRVGLPAAVAAVIRQPRVVIAASVLLGKPGSHPEATGGPACEPAGDGECALQRTVGPEREWSLRSRPNRQLRRSAGPGWRLRR